MENETIKLSKYIEDNEEIWTKENEKLLELLFKKLQEKLHIDFYQKYQKENSIDLYSYISGFLLANYQKALYESFNELNIDISTYEKQLIYSLILSINKNRSNLDFLIRMFINAGIITRIYYNDSNEYFIETNNYGTISFKKASVEYQDIKSQEILKKENLFDGCHEYSLEFLLAHPQVTAVTVVTTRLINLKYYHSFIIDGDKVVDVANNIVMDRDTYYMLEKMTELNSLNYEEYFSSKDESKHFDESHTLFDLLRMAAYKEITINQKTTTRN